MEQVYKLVYCSRNLLSESRAEQNAEVQKILESSRRNNVRDGVTGALLFNGEWFAQVLEGPLARVEMTFERIQCDPRHADVTVLESGPTDARIFADWSMAYAGADDAERARMQAVRFERLLENPSAAALEVHELLESLVSQEVF